MKRWSLTLILVSLLSGSTVVARSLPETSQPPGKALTTREKPARRGPDRALMQEINDAWATLNPDNAARYYDQSSENVFFDVAPFKYTGWRDYARGARETLATLESMKCTVGKDAVVHVSGNLAWGTATLHLETVDKSGRAQAMDLRWTPVWERKGETWLLVHDHLSAPLEPSK